mgnify:CR=1 FL=1
MRLCVIGDPVGHSLSPLLHRRMLDRAGLTGSYETVTVTPDTLPEFLAAARAARFALGDCRLLTAARHGGDIPLDRLPQAARDSLVVINATPLGMEGFPPFASLSFLDALPPGAAVFDLVYHPRQTALLAAAQDRGLTAIGGMELLVQQAILAFSRFTGTALDRESVRRDLLAMVGEK